MKLWDKGKELDGRVLDFTAGEDYLLDGRLVYYDCMGTIAHVKTLERAGILTGREAADAVTVLREVAHNGLTIRKEDEDVHTALENYMAEKLGECGKKVHTGRSRNDQVMVDLQLWCRTTMHDLQKAIFSLCETLNEFSRNNPALMPGYTHMQRAMPSSLQLLIGSYIESLFDDLELLETAYRINNRNPLGSAAGYGSTLPLDRRYSAALLGFDGVRNCVYVQARSKHICTVLVPVKSLMRTLEKIASDLLMYTMGEFDFFELPDELCTGSSIMPQKKNYDLLELIRAHAPVVNGCFAAVEGIGSKLMSGYSRDYQMTKGPLMKSFDVALQCLEILGLVFTHLQIHGEKMGKALTPDMFATDRAYEMVKDGTPFRTAYRDVAKSLDTLSVPENVYEKREHLGFRDYSPEIGEKRRWWQQACESHCQVLKDLESPGSE